MPAASNEVHGPRVVSLEDSSLQQKVNGLIDFERQVLESLASGVDAKDVARDARRFLVGLYAGGNPNVVPSGMDLGVSVNDICNLSCGHCYYAGTHLKKSNNTGALSVGEWNGLVSQAAGLGVDHISIIGKEPLLSPERTRAIVEAIDVHRGNGVEIRPEIITNGTLIPENIGWLREHLDFYFFSISFDGFGKDHDAVRGNGSYMASRKGLGLAANAGIKNRTAIFTAMPHNVGSLKRMAGDLVGVGLNHLSVGYCFPTSHNKSELVAGVDLFKRTLDVASEMPGGLEFSLNLIGDDHAPIIAALHKEGFFQRSELAATEDLAPSLVVPISAAPDGSSRALLNCTILPTMFYGGFRIDYDGLAMDFCSDLRVEERRGFGSIRESSLADLSGVARNLWVGYAEKYYGRLARAFRGESLEMVDGWYRRRDEK